MNVFIIFAGGRLHTVHASELTTDAELFVLQLDHPGLSFSVLDVEFIGAN